MKTATYLLIIQVSLLLLWLYAATSKLVDYDRARTTMISQVFPVAVAELLVWLIPAVELLIAALILAGNTLLSFYLSAFLLLLFTIYIALINAAFFDHVPCACGGMIEKLSWSQHLVFNLFFLGLSILGIIIHHKERRLENHN